MVSVAASLIEKTFFMVEYDFCSTINRGGSVSAELEHGKKVFVNKGSSCKLTKTNDFSD